MWGAGDLWLQEQHRASDVAAEAMLSLCHTTARPGWIYFIQTGYLLCVNKCLREPSAVSS